MRVCKCPDCGTVIIDDPRWRPSGFKWGADHTRLEDFRSMKPELAKAIELAKDHWAEDELHLYHLSKYGNVTRVAKLEYDKKSFMCHLTDSATGKNPYPKKFHVETLKKQRKLME